MLARGLALRCVQQRLLSYLGAPAAAAAAPRALSTRAAAAAPPPPPPAAWAPPSRAAQLARLRSEEFDVVVVGGGCVGAGVAWEAATRGLRVALVEREDFGSGTSGRSTKLIHGGIRYLEAAFKNLDLGLYRLVHEALEERAHLLNAAPYMAQPLATLLPLRSWWEVPYVWAGTKVYDWLAGAKRFVPPSRLVSAAEALRRFPSLSPAGLAAAIVYYDGSQNDTRMNLMIALTAAQAGAAAANYCAVASVAKDAASGAASGVTVVDALAPPGSPAAAPFAIRARAVVNATGCFGDALRALDAPGTPPLIQGAAGVHLILPAEYCPANLGLIIPRTRDGRVLFLLPWEGRALAGTTDAPCAISAAPRPAEADIEFILGELREHLARPVPRSDVLAAWSGIRPLLKDPAAPPGATGTAALSRTHVVDVSASGMVSVLGGKWTTYRRMAQDAVDAVGGVLRRGAALPPSVTAPLQLLGADRDRRVCGGDFGALAAALAAAPHGFPPDVAAHLAGSYGTRALGVAAVAAGGGPALRERLAPGYPYIAAEALYGVSHECACSVEDVLARRTRLAYLDAGAARGAVAGVAALMAQALGWGEGERARQEAAAHAFLDTMDGPAGSGQGRR